MKMAGSEEDHLGGRLRCTQTLAQRSDLSAPFGDSRLQSLQLILRRDVESSRRVAHNVLVMVSPPVGEVGTHTLLTLKADGHSVAVCA